MKSLRGQCFLVVFLIFLAKVYLLENGLARTPPMGWMSWGYYMCGDKCDQDPQKCLNEDLIMSVADAFFKEGYQEAGYEYIIIDDCWSEKYRHPMSNRLMPNKERFPQGMKFLADYIHSKGLKFGMYTNIATITCMNYPGSRGHFKLDAQTLAEWDVDYLKVDGCFVEEDYLRHAYIDLGKQLNRTGRPMVYSCSWPYYIQYIHNKTPDYIPIMKHCNLWRNYHDVFLNWPSIRGIINHYTREARSLAKYHGPGHWNDPDMLIFGTGVLSEGHSRVQLAVYAMMSAPLLLSCPMEKITPYEKKLLQNLDLISIAQDPLGIMATPHREHDPLCATRAILGQNRQRIWPTLSTLARRIGEMTKTITLWVKKHLPMKGDLYPSFSFALVNLSDQLCHIHIMPSDYGLDSPDGYTVMDVFTQTFLHNITIDNNIPFEVPSEDVVLYTLYPL